MASTMNIQEIGQIIFEFCNDPKDGSLMPAKDISALFQKVMEDAAVEENPTDQAIVKVYGSDKVKRHIADVKPSQADCAVFRGKEILKKSYYQLESGQVVEVLTFDDKTQRCIGSFTSTPEECCQEGWAAYHSLTDKQWCQLVSDFTKEKIDKADDWSCGWNSLQNLIYIQTGMKMSVMELMHAFALKAKKEGLAAVQSIAKASNPVTRESAKEACATYLKMMLGFFSMTTPMPLFCFGNLQEELLLGAKHTICLGGDFVNVTHVSASQLADKIKAHSFAVNGPLLLQAGSEGLLLHADKNGQIILIDPHNLKRTPAFSAQSSVQQFNPLGRSFWMKTTHGSMGGCTTVSGLDKDIDPRKLQELLSQSKGASVESVSKEISSLGKILEQFEQFFQ